MVIERGVDWGSPGALPPGATVAEGNIELQAAVWRGERVIGVTGGDLCRTLNGAGLLSMAFPIDLCHFRAEGVDEIFVAHCVARGGWWFGPILAVMNAQYIGTWDVAPRSHPNDGVVDVLKVTMSLADRFKARKRLATGTHVPHPAIAQQRVRSTEVVLAKPTNVWLDGVPVGLLQRFTIDVEPDALTVVI